MQQPARYDMKRIQLGNEEVVEEERHMPTTTKSPLQCPPPCGSPLLTFAL